MLRMRHCGLMAMAGIWEHWLGADGSEIETMAILTVAASRAVSALHDRMPAILPPDAFDVWLDCRSGSAFPAADFLRPAPEDLLKIVEVSKKINSPKNEGPDVQEPVRTRLL